MLSLMGGLYRYMFEPREFFVLLLGLDNAGKTSLLERLKQIQNPKYGRLSRDKLTPTIGLNVGQLDLGKVSKAKNCGSITPNRLVFWDLGGEEELQELWEKYYREAHGIIFVIDACDRARLRESHNAFDRVIRETGDTQIPVLVLANKLDRAGAMSIPEIKTVFNESAHLIGARDLKVMCVSAETGENVRSALGWLAEKVRGNESRPPVVQL